MLNYEELKKAQLNIILNHNPMLDDYHVGVRKLSDIKTFAEVVNDDESFVYGDFSQQDALNALKAGTITVYSSKPINTGDFISTSHRMAKDYAGSGRVNQRTVNLTEVAWINGDEGVYTGPIKLKEDKVMNIKVETTQVLSEKLKANLISLASKYHPEGVIKITPDITMTGAYSAVYTPAPQDYSPLVIRVAGGEITGIGKRFGEETDPKIKAFKNAFNKAKKRVSAKQQAPALTPHIKVDDFKGVSEALKTNLITAAGKYYPEGHIRIFKNGEVRYYPESNKYPQVALIYDKNNVVQVVDTNTLNKTANTPKAPVKSQLPTIDLTKFNDLELPNSSANCTYESTGPFDVNHSLTEATGTHYLTIGYYKVRSKDDYRQHRLMGKSVPELITKLETFLEVPAGSLNMLQDTVMTQKYGPFPVINSKKLANFLTQCSIKK